MAKVTVDTIRNIKRASLERTPKKHTSSSSVTHGGGGVRRDNTLGGNTSSSGSPYRGPSNIPANSNRPSGPTNWPRRPEAANLRVALLGDPRVAHLEATHIHPVAMLIFQACYSLCMSSSCHSSSRSNRGYPTS